LLTELDGLESRRSVFVIAATNRPELIDPAMLRPGRLDKRLYVPLPCAAERASILAAVARKAKVAPGLDLAAVAADPRCDGFSGADLAALLREAGLAVLRALPRPSALDRHTKAPAHVPAAAALVPPSAAASGSGAGSDQALTVAVAGLRVRMEIGPEHFEAALCKVRPSVSKADRDRYARMRDELEGN
jgi:ribosome biogenesis ATPase